MSDNNIMGNTRYYCYMYSYVSYIKVVTFPYYAHDVMYNFKERW